MGLVKKKKLHDYWSTDPIINTPLYSNCMARDRYQYILSNLHFYDMLKRENREAQYVKDKMRRIQLVFDHLRSSFSNAHNPSKNLVIDESLVLWRGNILLRQYIPSERHRFGLKLFVLCDCKSGFLQDLILYTGKDTQIGGTETFGVSGAVVLELLEQYLGRGHTLFIDNWYTSPLLAEELLKYDTGICGTVKRNRKHMPTLDQTLQTKEVIFFQDKNVLLTTWQDKREVNVLSTVHNPVVIKTKSKAHRSWVWKPECVIDYNVNMRLVDQSDGMIASVECVRPTEKWYKKLFFHMIDIAVLNSHILHRNVTGSGNTLSIFARNLARQIIGEYVPAPLRSSSTFNSRPHERLTGRHFPEKIPTRKRCHVCYNSPDGSKNVKTSGQCRECQKALCLPDCFTLYHTYEKACKCKPCRVGQNENVPPRP